MKSKQAVIKQTRASLKLTGFRTLSARSVFWDFLQFDSLKSALDNPRYQEYIRELSCVLSTCILENWNWTLTVDDDVEREHKDARSLKNVY